MLHDNLATHKRESPSKFHAPKGLEFDPQVS